MDYALLDWDNTLRQGYTLFSWIDYLIEVGTVGSVVREEIDYYIEEYLKDKISHDQIAAFTNKNIDDVKAIIAGKLTIPSE